MTKFVRIKRTIWRGFFITNGVPVGKVSTNLAQTPKIVYLIRVEGRQPHHTPNLLSFLSMRKIEQQMNNAISNNANWQSGNTSVHFNEEENLSIVRLHGNKIAEVGDTFIRLFDGGWQSNTTKSRLNAILSEHGDLGDRVFAKNFDWFVSMSTDQGISTVPFFSSMRLG